MDDIPQENINDVYTKLADYSPVFKNFKDKFDSYTSMFNYFVNIDAYKDNNLAFKNGSNDFFTLQHSNVQPITTNLSNFKETMRSTIGDLEKVKMSYLLHIHKLKYKSGGKLPPPDILNHLTQNITVNACFDSGSGPDAIFGDKNRHEKYADKKLLCSVANTVIDPGPSGASCDVNIENTYKPTLNSEFFNKFGYNNIIEFKDTGNKTFELILNGKLSNKAIKINNNSTSYLAGNNENNKYFSQKNANKEECDIRTTLKKLGDDLQVFISCLYKNKLGANSTALVMMLTCDLGVSFASLMLGVDCVFKDKDEVQKVPGQQKIGNSWYMKSILGAPEPDFSAEIEKTRKYVLDEYDEFISIISEILTKLTSNNNITIQIKGDASYDKQQMIDTNGFFENMYNDLNKIKEEIKTMTVNSDSSSIDELKKCVPNKFILRHKMNPDIYAFMLAQKYTRGNINDILNNGTTGKTKATPFVQYFKTMIRKIVTIKRGGLKGIPLKEYFIDAPLQVSYEYSYVNPSNISLPYEKHVYDTGNVNYKNTVVDERMQFFEYVAEEFKKKYTRTISERITNMYTTEDLYYNCLSYIDDALHGYANYDKIPEYINEYMVMLNTWLSEETKKGISSQVSMETGKRKITEESDQSDQMLIDDDMPLDTSKRYRVEGLRGGKSTRKKHNNLHKKKRTNKKRKTRKNELSK